jgi:integrase
MGHIQKRGDRKYLARWIDPEGRERAKAFTKKEDAKRHLTAVEGAMLAGAYVDHTNRTTVLEYARQWATTRPHQPTTAARVKAYIEHHIAGTRIANRRLVALRPSEVQAWATDRSKVLAPITARLLVGLLRSIFASAVLDGLVTSNPVLQVSLPRTERERIIPLTVAEVQTLAESMPDRCRAMVITQAGLGLRIGELLALRVRDVKFLERTVEIEHQLTKDGRELVPPKTPMSKRTLPLPQVVAEALSMHIATYPPATDGLLFTTTTGRPYRQAHYGAQIFAAAVRRSGLPAGTSSHSLRHHYASVLLDAGQSLVAVAERLGHENGALVLRTYGHLMPNSEDRTRRAIDDAWTVDGLQTDPAYG